MLRKKERHEPAHCNQEQKSKGIKSKLGVVYVKMVFAWTQEKLSYVGFYWLFCLVHGLVWRWQHVGIVSAVAGW